MKIITLCILAAILLRPVHADSSAASFDNHTGAPKEWTSGVTGKGEAIWKIEKDATAPSKPNVLKQSGVGAYPVLLKDEPLVKDGFVEVKGKAISGKEDQAIGVIWRAKDTNNYYVCRANATEDNIVLYKTVDGKRSSLDIVGRKGGYGVEAKVPPQTWHTLRVEFAGDHLPGKGLTVRGGRHSAGEPGHDIDDAAWRTASCGDSPLPGRPAVPGLAGCGRAGSPG